MKVESEKPCLTSKRSEFTKGLSLKGPLGGNARDLLLNVVALPRTSMLKERLHFTKMISIVHLA